MKLSSFDPNAIYCKQTHLNSTYINMNIKMIKCSALKRGGNNIGEY